jgi:predicted ATP-grasp superfamily ATP-dependent carboligase
VPEGRGLRAYETGPEGVEENLEGGEEDFAEDVVEQEQLGTGGEVGVDAVFAEVLVVLDVVPLEEMK